MKQVLILNITRMGDLVQMGGLLSRLQEEWPGAAVDLVVDRRFAPVASFLPGLREVITVDFHAVIDDSRAAVKDAVALYQELAAWVNPLCDRRYDRVINLTFNLPSALLAGCIGAPDIRGARSAWDGGTIVDNPWMAYFCDFHRFRQLNRFNLVDIYALGGSRPGSFSPLNMVIPTEDRLWARWMLADSSEWIAVQAGASDGMKAWRPHLFGQALARVSTQWKGGILFIGNSEEQATIAEVIRVYREAEGARLVKNLAGHTTLGQLAALLAESRILLTNDTGPMHVAVAAGTSVLDLSVGHVDFQETGPYGPGHWVVQPNLDCAPCGFDQICAHHACKDRIPQDFVAELLLNLLQKSALPRVPVGVRLYESGVDEDGLGTFRMRGGTEPLATTWYATYWRRYWYEAHTGLASKIPMADGPPPEGRAVKKQLRTLIPLVKRASRKADEVMHLARQRPVDLSRLKQRQQQQSADREQLVQLGMSQAATTPVTVAFLRQLQGDNVRGLDQLARHQAEAYQTWMRRLVHIDQQIGEMVDGSSRPSGSRPTGAPMYGESQIA